MQPIGLFRYSAERQYFLLCPKCILLRLEGPDRVRAHRRTATSQPARRPVCARWHHLGSSRLNLSKDTERNLGGCGRRLGTGGVYRPEYLADRPSVVS